MTWLSPTLLFLVTWLAVFFQTGMLPLRVLIGAPPSILPAIVVYAAFTHSLAVVSFLTIVAALWADSLSGSRLGSGVAPLFVVGFLLHTRQHLLLREQRYAQFWLGFASGVAVPVAHAGILLLGSSEPAVGWFTLRQLLGLGLLNGLACPAIFLLFDGLRGTFEYQLAGPGPYTANREMKRGRH
jgi:cell shape-determining protein MreD